MALREYIQGKALVCIDEVCASSDMADASFYPVDKLLDDAARWVIRAVPSRMLAPGKELPIDKLHAHEDGSGELPLPDDFFRLLRFRMEGWHRPVITPIRDTDERYAQQFNCILRGSESKPVVALNEECRRMEYFSSRKGSFARVVEARYFGFTEVNDKYPEQLADITAWKTAELVLSVMNDTVSMQLCAGRVTEILQLL